MQYQELGDLKDLADNPDYLNQFIGTRDVLPPIKSVEGTSKVIAIGTEEEVMKVIMDDDWEVPISCHSIYSPHDEKEGRTWKVVRDHGVKDYLDAYLGEINQKVREVERLYNLPKE